MDQWWQLIYSKVMILVGIHQFLVIVCHFLAKIFLLRKREYAVYMATGVQRGKRSVDCLVCVPMNKIGKFQQNR